MSTTTWHGDLARYTGKTMTVHGGLFYEIELLEGHLKGQTKVTQRAPEQANMSTTKQSTRRLIEQEADRRLMRAVAERDAALASKAELLAACELAFRHLDQADVLLEVVAKTVCAAILKATT